MNKFILLVMALFCFSCGDKEDSIAGFPNEIEDFANQILQAIQTKDEDKLYALQIPPEISAKYGFYDFVSHETMFENVKSPKEFIELANKNAEEKKPLRITYIKEFFERIHTRNDWKDAKIVKVDIEPTQDKELTNLLTKRKKTVTLHNLKAYVLLANGNKLILSTPFAMKFDDKWILYATVNSGVDVLKDKE